METNQSLNNQKTQKPTGILKLILIDIIVTGLAVYFYFDLTKFEKEGGSRNVHTLVKVLYDLGGKWAVVGTLGGISLVCMFFIIKKLSSTNDANQLS